MAFRIYTKTGDTGKTSLIGGTRVSKSHLRIESYGTVDELNSHIGLLRDQLADAFSIGMLKEIQDRLFTIGSCLACDPDKEVKMKVPDLHDSDIDLLEREMDRMEELLPVMKNFILPGGLPASSQAHICRCVCRRAERTCVSMTDHEMAVEPLVIKYLNRLSDYLFVLARYTTHLAGAEEITWKPRI